MASLAFEMENQAGGSRGQPEEAQGCLCMCLYKCVACVLTCVRVYGYMCVCVCIMCVSRACSRPCVHAPGSLLTGTRTLLCRVQHGLAPPPLRQPLWPLVHHRLPRFGPGLPGRGGKGTGMGRVRDTPVCGQKADVNARGSGTRVRRARWVSFRHRSLRSL